MLWCLSRSAFPESPKLRTHWLPEDSLAPALPGRAALGAGGGTRACDREGEKAPGRMRGCLKLGVAKCN